MWTKESKREYQRKYQKEYVKKNKEKLWEYRKTWGRNNAEKNKAYKLKWIENNKEYKKEYNRKWKIKNKVRLNEHKKEYCRLRYKNEISFRINRLMSGNVCKSIKGNKNGQHWEDIVGYTLEQLKRHLEKQFTPEMNWENQGSYWHIEHRTPISWYKFNSYEDKQFKLCWSLENLRPLEAKENLRKGNRLILEN